MRIIYCDSVLDRKLIEPDYEEEKNAAIKHGFNFSLISYEAITDNNITSALQLVKTAEKKEWGIYRGWMLTAEQYQRLYDALLQKNIQLINSPTEYIHCHHFPLSYAKIAHKTPYSKWTIDITDKSIQSLAQNFGNAPIIVKDYVKSEKHHWKEACFIPNASDIAKVNAIVHTFIELRGDYLNEGLVFRQFEELKYLTQHSKSGMPLTKEYRLFFINKKTVLLSPYWEEGTYHETSVELDEFIEIAQTIDSNFFTMDIAQKKNGEWIVMELGDGQVAGLPESMDVNEFYDKLKESMANSTMRG